MTCVFNCMPFEWHRFCRSPAVLAWLTGKCNRLSAISTKCRPKWNFKVKPIPLVLVIFSLSLCGNGISGEYTQKREILNILDNKMRLEGIPGASIAIVRNGTLWWSDALGMADLENNVRATPGTVYRVGSLVKPITASAILQMVAESKLDLDQPVWQYCPAFPEKSEVVSVRGLLSHTSGVRSYQMPWSVYEAELYSAKRYDSVTESLQIFASDDLLFVPGSEYKYTSYGYNVLGCVVESVSKQPYFKYIEENILTPAGMENTYVDVAEAVIAKRAKHYSRNKKGKLENAKYVDMTNKIPSGGLVSNALDIAGFSIAYMNNRIIPRELVNLSAKPAVINGDTEINYGFGWELPEAVDGERPFELLHSGITPGASAIMYLYPESKDAIIILTNLYLVSGREKLVNRIREVLTRGG